MIEFDKPFTYKASVADGVLTENKVEQEAGHAGAVIGFKTRKGEVTLGVLGPTWCVLGLRL